MSDNPEPGGVSPANGSPPNQTPSKASSQRDDVRSTVEESNASSDQGLSEAGDKHANTAPTGLATETVEDRRGPRGVRGWLSDLFSDEPEDLPELMEILRDAAQRELLDTDALNIIFGALHVADMHARDIMIPRSSLVVVGEHEDPQQLLATIIESQHSRYPVVGEDMDDVKGILHAKDLLGLALDAEQPRFAIKDYIRPATVIPESKRLNVLLQEFRANRNHMALVVDEYGQIAGAVTIEDVLEQIVGDIEDEHDVEDDSAITQLEPHSFNVKATVAIEDFNEYFGADIADDEFDTVGGVVLQAFGHLPERGECVDVKEFQFEVLNADSRRLRLLRVKTPK